MSMQVHVKKKLKLYYSGHPLPKWLKYCYKPLWLYKSVIDFLSSHSDYHNNNLHLWNSVISQMQNY